MPIDTTPTVLASDTAKASPASSPFPPLGPSVEHDRPTLLCGSDARLDELRRHFSQHPVDGGLRPGAIPTPSRSESDGAGEVWEGDSSSRVDEGGEEEKEGVLVQCSARTTLQGQGGFKDVGGTVVVSTRRVLFVVSDPSRIPPVPVSDEQKGSDVCQQPGQGQEGDGACSRYDLAIDAGCITLHALSSEPLCVYCQVQTDTANGEHFQDGYINPDESPNDVAADEVAGAQNPGDDEVAVGGEPLIWRRETETVSEGPMEVFFAPLLPSPNQDGSSKTEQELCQELFDALSTLASLNPLPADEEDDGYGMPGFGFAGGDEEMVTAWDNDGPGGATEEEREAMLRRLDGVLTVPPEYEIADEKESGEVGQFDDAEEDDGLL